MSAPRQQEGTFAWQEVEVAFHLESLVVVACLWQFLYFKMSWRPVDPPNRCGMVVSRFIALVPVVTP